MDFLDKITAAFAGHRTYLIAIVAGLLAAASALGYVVPEWVFTMLGALGLYTVRAAVARLQ